jgi:ankyrin repeat protein
MDYNQLTLDHLHRNPLGEWHVIDNICEGDPLRQWLTGDTSIHIFCKLGAYGDVLRLLNDGIDINSRDPNGDTPLLTALLTGNMTVVRELLNYQSENNILDVNCKRTHFI